MRFKERRRTQSDRFGETFSGFASWSDAEDAVRVRFRVLFFRFRARDRSGKASERDLISFLIKRSIGFLAGKWSTELIKSFQCFAYEIDLFF